MFLGIGKSQSKTLSFKEFWGAEIRIIEYSLGKGEYTYHRDCNDLHFRMTPDKLPFKGGVDGSRQGTLGPVAFYPARCRLDFSSDDFTTKARVMVCSLSDEWVNAAISPKLNLADIDREACRTLASPLLSTVLRRLTMEMTTPGLASDMFAEAILQMAVIEVARELTDLNTETTNQGTLSPAQMSRLHEILDDETIKEFKASIFADALGMSISSLQRQFKTTTGRTLHDYIMEWRLEQVKKLLSETNLPLKTIAHRLGFSSDSALSIAFSRLVGRSPGAYRKVAFF